MKRTIWIISLMLILVMSVGVSAEVPPDPIGLSYDRSTSGHVIWSWAAGSGYVTDSFNMSINGVWTNASTVISYDHNVGTGSTSTIMVYAYNVTDAGNVSASYITGSQNGVQTFSGVVDIVDAIIPLFDGLLNLILAVFPLTIAMALLGALTLLIAGVFYRITKGTK